MKYLSFGLSIDTMIFHAQKKLLDHVSRIATSC